PDEMLLGVLDALADRLGNLACLAEPAADVARTITDHDDRAEAEAPAALDDLCDAVDLDDALLQRQLVRVNSCHDVPFRVSGSCRRPASEAQPGSAGAVRERLHPPVVAVAGAIEDDLLDTGGLRAFGHEAADDTSLGGLGLLRVPKFLFQCRRSGQRSAGR